jgi:hypothetical protein
VNDTVSDAWVAPSSSMKATQIFTATYWDPNGATAIEWVQLLFGVATNGGGEPFCYLHYDRIGNGLWLYSNDYGSFVGPVTPGVASSELQTTACKVNTAGAIVASAGGVLQLTVPVTFQGAFQGNLNTYERAYDILGNDTGMQQKGTWVIP